jgi:UDP-N-acetylmuramate dehydrogenase
MVEPSARDELRRLVRGRLRFDEPMARHTTLRIGGPADVWVEPADIQELAAVRGWCWSRGLPCRAVGAGSNLLVLDAGVRGVLLSTVALRGLERVGVDEEGRQRLVVQAGVSTGKLLSAATAWELGGVEFLGGVPGSVGGGLIMNAGTYLGEFKDVTVQVRSVTPTGAIRQRTGPECGFVYRGSALPPDEIVVETELALAHRPRGEIEQAVRQLRDRRREREPHAVANSGSTFKNPPGDYAGRLIEACGLKGRSAGGAQISTVHANWIVNTGGATAAELLELIALARAEVLTRFGIELQLEVRVLGEELGS